jgi:hypothetical protein
MLPIETKEDLRKRDALRNECLTAAELGCCEIVMPYLQFTMEGAP